MLTQIIVVFWFKNKLLVKIYFKDPSIALRKYFYIFLLETKWVTTVQVMGRGLQETLSKCQEEKT